jgi:hypothetical protein
MPLDGPIMRYCLDRPPHRISRDPILRGEFALCREPAGRRPLTRGNAFAQGSFNFGCDHFGQSYVLIMDQY